MPHSIEQSTVFNSNLRHSIIPSFRHSVIPSFRHSIIPSLIFLLTSSVSAQSPLLFKWWLELKDKDGTPYTVDHPEAFLSARSIDRRAKNGSPTTWEDLPVSPLYLNALRAKGFRIHGYSRWLNGVAIIADTATALRAQALPFVKNMQCVGRDIRITNPPNRPPKKRGIPTEPPPDASARFGPLGYSVVNLGSIATPFLHKVGARGNGIWVAVMDGGFLNTDTIPLFDSVAYQGRLWPGPDVVERDGGVFESAQHGTAVLSVMAANVPNYFVGAAPEATYFLLKTEDTGGEFPIEEVNWVIGAEWADSIGVDIINASLGYTTFSNPAYNRPYSALDGRSSIGARGATIAAQKGMIICNSAGNSGDEPWHYIGVPADAPGVIAVGAFDSQTGAHASFSSYGPTADGRIKPDLSVAGQNVITAANLGYDLTVSAGTSIASPILVGSIAALWSAFPHLSADQITQAVFNMAHQLTQPDNELGYGVPDFSAVWRDLKGFSGRLGTGGMYGYDPHTRTLSLLFPSPYPDFSTGYRLTDALGRTVAQGPLPVEGRDIKTIALPLPFDLPRGAYCLSLGKQQYVVGIF